VVRQVLYDNMKTVVLERDAQGEGAHRYHAGFLDYARHAGFVIKLCRPYRARTKGKVERLNGYRANHRRELSAQASAQGRDGASARRRRLSAAGRCAPAVGPSALPPGRTVQHVNEIEVYQF